METIFYVPRNPVNGLMGLSVQISYLVVQTVGVSIERLHVFNGIHRTRCQAPDAVQKTKSAFNSLLAPFQITLGRCRKKTKKTRGIGTEFV